MLKLNVKILQGLQPYLPIWQAMRDFTDQRAAQPLTDEIWLVEHQPVFTQGQAGKPEHVLNPHDIPIIQTDRGGQVTYHGPGQLMMYTLLDIHKLKLNTRDYVRTLEQCIIDYLKTFTIEAENDIKPPVVYVNKSKICSIGLRVRKGFVYHGLALNIKMNLTPFSYINPCGFKSLKMTQLSDYVDISIEQVIQDLLPTFLQNFRYNQVKTTQVTLTELTNYDQATAI